MPPPKDDRFGIMTNDEGGGDDCFVGDDKVLTGEDFDDGSSGSSDMINMHTPWVLLRIY